MVVALSRSDSHYDGVLRVLNLLADRIVDDMKKAKAILIKPNFVSTHVSLSATPVDSVKALIDFIYKYVGRRHIIIAEGPALGSIDTALRNYGYIDLKDEYDVEFFDINEDPEYEIFKVYSRSLRRDVKVRVSKTVLEADYRISICRPKTHDTVVVTLSVKNMVMGAIMGTDKSKMHQGYLAINMNIAEMARYLMPELAIIDGYVGMEGNGPVGGSPVRWGVALAGTNPVEVDALTAWLMGFEPEDVGYLFFLNKMGYGEINPKNINVIGEDSANLRIKFAPHRTYRSQLSWRDRKEEGLRILGLI